MTEELAQMSLTDAIKPWDGSIESHQNPDQASCWLDQRQNAGIVVD